MCVCVCMRVCVCERERECILTLNHHSSYIRAEMGGGGGGRRKGGLGGRERDNKYSKRFIC